MTSDPQPENPTKVLSESWATLSVSDAHSEDGTRSEQTDVGSLIDQTSADDVASLDDRYSSSEVGGNDEDHDDDHPDGHDNGNDDEDEDESESEDSDDGNEEYDGRSSVSESQELPALYHRFGGAVEDSGLTAQAAFKHSSSESIEFVEPEKWPEMDLVELKHTFKFFGGAEASGLKEQLPDNLQDSVLMATVQQTMTKQSLDIDQPFRVLYIGNPDFRNIILDKIGDVLVSSSSGSGSSSIESSRYHVVPTSFGAGDVPNFAELLPIHVQLIVDECLEASSDLRSGKPNTLSLNFKNRAPCTSSWTGSEYCLSSPSDWTLPNVAIFFVSSKDDTAALETRHLARAFMERHGVPAMVISEKPLWTTTADLIPLNRHSLHVCLESHSRHASETVVLRRYPIDLQTFESITPGQLNRNLASLASIYPKQPHKVTKEAPKPSPWESIFDIEKYKKHLSHFSDSSNTQDLAVLLRILALAVLFAITISLGYSVVNSTLVFLSQFFVRSGVPNAASPSPSNIHTTSIIPVDGQRQTSLSVQSSAAIEAQPHGHQGHQAEDYSHFEELMGIALSTPTQRGNSDNFELQVVGDCHVVLKPPRSFVAKKHPKFSVGVTRRENALPYELSKLFDGVYSLKLDREDAHGLVNVTISTTVSKTPLTQTTQVDFGTPWLKIANWKRAASALSSQFTQDLSTAQTSLSRAYNRLCTDVSVVMSDAVKGSHVLWQEIDVLRHDSVQVSRETKNLVLTGTKQLSEVFRRNAVQPFWAACSVFQQQTGKINTDTKNLLSRTWSAISDISLPEVNLKTTMDRVRDVRKCDALSRAQTRAQGLMRRYTCHDSGCSVQGHSR